MSVDMAGLPERGDLRASWLAGFKRPFRLDSLLVERFLGGRRWVDAGKIRNQVRVAAVPCAQNAPDSKARLWVPVFDVASDVSQQPELGVSVRVGDWWEIEGIRVIRPGEHVLLDSLPSRHTIRAIWVAVCSPDSARSAPDAMWEQTAVNWAERPANELRAEEIHGWLAGVTALQAVQRRLGLLPDSLDLVFESRGRNH